MPFRNRVTPAGDLIAVPERGTLTGNRGVLHDRHGVVVRRSQLSRWISCELAFRGRHRAVMAPGRYTHLFFLDEATALAAGHRPCAECRHAAYQQFRQCWAAAHPPAQAQAHAGAPAGAGLPPAAAMDDVLRAERALTQGRRRSHDRPASALPDGAFVELPDGAWLVRAGQLLRWTPAGYTDRRPLPPGGLPVLTPPTLVAVLAAGYVLRMHPTAGRG